MLRAVFISLLAGCVPCATAQHSLAGPHFSAHFGGNHYAGHYSRGYGYAVPWLWDSVYADDAAEYPPPEHPAFQRILTSDTTPVPPAEPLLIELRGDRYVRLSGNEDSTAQVLEQPTADFSHQPSPSTISVKSPAAVLVFRDGHRQEISAYTISGGALYAQTFDFINGPSNWKVALASLNLPETLSENQSRGVRFQLPNAANEVIVGP